MTDSPLSLRGQSTVGDGERLTPNFILLWQPDDAPYIHPTIPTPRSGGLRLRGEERAWEMVGLYHDEDEAFKAFETWRPLDGVRGQLVISQISGLAYTTSPTSQEGGRDA